MRRAFVMISAEREVNTGRENVKRNQELSSYLAGYYTSSVFHPCIGRYDGFTENSWRIDLDEYDAFDASILKGSEVFENISDDLYNVWEISQSFNQDSILYVNPFEDAFLIFHDKVIYHLGSVVEKAVVARERAFTIDLEDGVNWVVR